MELIGIQTFSFDDAIIKRQYVRIFRKEEENAIFF